MNIKFLLILLITLGLSACQTRIHSGTLIQDTQIEEIAGRELSKEEVEEKFGSPNLIPIYSPSTWYYVHREMTRRAFFNPVIVGQKVVKFVFEGDKLMSVEVKNNEHDPNLAIQKDYIKSKGTDLNPVQEYVKNFGKFNKGKKKDPRR